ncbi:MAG: bifunctional diaminohydroxyphosphoribosylaminopyrimidine deaminase/5-amino-6-(5-phosphoribosylamino)uracil reductase RibD [Saprospiraceae bacterium]|nr:bifunctional diaminohydroxyphosphoribosylaminopyrimidine deaminase/5-amino-6-(5-phosphoribosylamino)uracil reductase RibD [Saprospiraceae bacterium]
MQRAIQLASLGLGKTAPNPCVGSVIVYEDRIIGEGFHRLCGTAHAEVNAVNSVKIADKHLLSKSTIYVTLEPCHHYGKTPPCVDLILGNKIPKIVIGCQDPNPKVGGKSIKKLRNNGIEVIVGVLEKECWEVAKRFMTFFTKKRPYIILKYAKSKDNFIGKPTEQIWITGSQSKRLVHKWRNEEGAILVGTNTAAIDNPSLTNRLWYGKNPLRLVIDTQGKLDENLNIFDNYAATKVFEKGDIPLILKELYDLKINSLIVEGGATLLNSFIEQELWDEARIFTGDVYLKNGIEAPNFPNISPMETKIIGKDKLEIFRNFKEN